MAQSSMYDARDRHLQQVVRDAIVRARKNGYETDVRSVRILDAKLRKAKYRCRWCGGPFECIDHVKPLARGGKDMLRNLAPSCRRCNELKGDLPLSTWRPIAAQLRVERQENRAPVGGARDWR